MDGPCAMNGPPARFLTQFSRSLHIGKLLNIFLHCFWPYFAMADPAGILHNLVNQLHSIQVQMQASLIVVRQIQGMPPGLAAGLGQVLNLNIQNIQNLRVQEQFLMQQINAMWQGLGFP